LVKGRVSEHNGSFLHSVAPLQKNFLKAFELNDSTTERRQWSGEGKSLLGPSNSWLLTINRNLSKVEVVIETSKHSGSSHDNWTIMICVMNIMAKYCEPILVRTLQKSRGRGKVGGGGRQK